MEGALSTGSLSCLEGRDKEQRTPLLKAAFYGHLAIVRKLLEGGANVNARCGGNLTPLMFAVKNENMDDTVRADIVRELIKYQCNVNAKNGQRQTALHLAADKGYTSVAELLLEENADVNAIDENGWTALHYAANAPADQRQDNRFALIDLLVQYGAYVDARAHYDQHSPLHVASKNGSDRIAKILLDKQANPSSRGSDLVTPLVSILLDESTRSISS